MDSVCGVRCEMKVLVVYCTLTHSYLWHSLWTHSYLWHSFWTHNYLWHSFWTHLSVTFIVDTQLSVTFIVDTQLSVTFIVDTQLSVTFIVDTQLSVTFILDTFICDIHCGHISMLVTRKVQHHLTYTCLSCNDDTHSPVTVSERQQPNDWPPAGGTCFIIKWQACLM